VDLKETFQYLFERLKAERPASVQIGSHHYKLSAQGVIDSVIEPVPDPWPRVVGCSTLRGLVDAYSAGLDGLKERVAFHVEDYNLVSLVSLDADKYGRRRTYAQAHHRGETPFEFDTYMAPEKFRLDFLASFFLNEDALKVIRLISSLGVKGEDLNVTDDGISQTVEIKSGTVVRGKVDLPTEGIPLVAWRTFRDVPPPVSKFLLRIKALGSVPMIALHEIDAKWRLDTIESIRGWIAKEVKDAIVIA
jgi:hypothetical protein